ncbi:MAG: flagellar export protein FliJ [Pseudomonadota bacterium]
MKSRESALRLKRFQEREKQRQVQQIETMIAEFDRMVAELDGQIAYEEKKAGIDDVTHFAYPTFAKAARQRRENLVTSVDELKEQLVGAQEALSEVAEELEKAELLEVRDGGKTRDSVAEGESDYSRHAMIG